MAFENAERYLNQKGFGDRIIRFETSSATVDLAAAALGVDGALIAKSLTFMTAEGPIMVLCAGDKRVSNPKFKEEFKCKAKMLTRDEVNLLVGHDVGGVCPFGINEGVRVFLDVSLKAFDTVYPACGDAASAVKLKVDELEGLANSEKWVDVCQ